MDAFYAAVEQRDRPELRGKPVVIGADPKGGVGRGVVSTASYEARRFGISSAMPISQAFKRCPHAVYLPPDMAKYSRVSDEVMDVLRRFTDRVEPVSIDEAFLDVTASQRAMGPGEAIANALKRSVLRATSLTASVGVASNKLVAKIASDMRKPDGLVVVPPGKEAAFLAPLAVRRLWGVGPKMEESLLRRGIRTIGDLAGLDRGAAESRFGTHGHDLILLARGIDDRPVQSDPGEAKSVGAEHTYDRDTADRETLRATLLTLADAVASRLRANGLRARTITLKYRDESFRTQTRAHTLRFPADGAAALFEAAWSAFGAIHGSKRVRLLGIYTSGFDEAQLDFFRGETPPIDRVRDLVAEKLGSGVVTRASLLGRKQR